MTPDRLFTAKVKSGHVARTGWCVCSILCTWSGGTLFSLNRYRENGYLDVLRDFFHFLLANSMVVSRLNHDQFLAVSLQFISQSQRCATFLNCGQNEWSGEVPQGFFKTQYNINILKSRTVLDLFIFERDYDELYSLFKINTDAFLSSPDGIRTGLMLIRISKNKRFHRLLRKMVRTTDCVPLLKVIPLSPLYSLPAWEWCDEMKRTYTFLPVLLQEGT